MCCDDACLNAQSIGLNPEYVGADVRDVETECAVLEGKDVFVMSGQDYSVRL